MFWFVIHTKPRQEARALQNLQQQGYECYLPQICLERVQGGVLTQVTEPLFPRYLFVRLDPSMQGKSWAPIRSTKGVSRLVSFGGQPSPVDIGLILSLQREEELRAPLSMYQPGDKVELIEGAFAGLDAVYEMNDGEARALVLIEMLSKPVRLRVSPAHLRRAV